MYPILLKWGTLILPSWHVFYVIGAVTAFYILVHLGHRWEPDIARRDLARLFAAIYVAGWLGSRALSIAIEEPPEVSFWPALFTFGAMTFYGGALAALGAAYGVARLKRLPYSSIIDLTVPPGLIALAIGRLGCFLNGDDYGVRAPLDGNGNPPWWSVTFPVLEDKVARWPVQLMEAASALLLAIFLVWAFARLRKRLRPGAVGALGIAGYACLRFGLEFLRDDYRGSVFGTWVSTSQFISICLMGAVVVLSPWWARPLPSASS